MKKLLPLLAICLASCSLLVKARVGAVCGNGEKEEAEECDDENNAPGDGCNEVCIKEFCGDGIVNNAGLEECDPPDTNEANCTLNCILPTAEKIFLGNSHTCITTETNSLRCWGINAGGQLGYGHTDIIGDDEFPSAALNVSIGAPNGDITQGVAGNAHSCVLFTGGGVRCWGAGASGRLGYNNTANIGDTPGSMDALVDLAIGVNDQPVQFISAGFAHTCAVSVGKVVCWGLGTDGRLGYEANISNVGDGTTSISAAGFVNFGVGEAAKVATGFAHTCVLLTTGEVRCWGKNDQGQLGYGQLAGFSLFLDPTQPYTGFPNNGDVPIDTDFTDIVAGANHTCAQTQNGDVFCWGHNEFGQLGYAVSEPNIGKIAGVQQQYTSLGISSVELGGSARQLAANTDHTCAVLTTNDLVCWGRNDFKQLGYPGNLLNDQSVGNDEVPSDIGFVASNVKQVAVGEFHTCALFLSGNIQCWETPQQRNGANPFIPNTGQLGYGDSNVVITPGIDVQLY